MSLIVYVLTNPAMPDLIKIGKTTRDDLQARMKELYTTGVPLPFDCCIAVEIESQERGDKLEKALHVAFEPNRLNRSREFFTVKSSQVEALLKIWPDARDVTPEIERDLDKDLSFQEKEDVRKFKRRRPNLNFKTMRIPDGSELVSTNDDHEKATVIGEKKVSFRGEEMSLTVATRMALKLDYAVAPCGHWTFEGRNLSDIYREVFPESSDSGVYEDESE